MRLVYTEDRWLYVTARPQVGLLECWEVPPALVGNLLYMIAIEEWRLWPLIDGVFELQIRDEHGSWNRVSLNKLKRGGDR